MGRMEGGLVSCSLPMHKGAQPTALPHRGSSKAKTAPFVRKQAAWAQRLARPFYQVRLS